MLDTSNWREYDLASLFTSFERGRRLTEYNRDPGSTPLVTAGYQNEGVADFISNSEQKRYCNKITIDMFCNVFYRDYEFCCDDNILVLINDNLNANMCLFLVSVIKADKFRFAYGRQYRQKDLLKHKVKLPTNKNGEPDWEYMDNYIEELQNRERESGTKLKDSLRTNNKIKTTIVTSNWKEYKLSDLFDIKYGINMELLNCEEENGNINFVARTSENNGVTAKVRPVEGKQPQKPGLITVAGGGSVLSSFLQEEPFYSGRDLYTLNAKDNIDRYAKLFILSLIRREKYKYSYGRQANKTLPDIEIKLPTKNGRPDYAFMSEYIKSLPYADRI